MDNIVIFINLDHDKIGVIIVDKENKSQIFIKNFDVTNDFNNFKTIIDNLNKILKSLIIELERKINNPINNMNLMIDDPKTLSIYASVKKNYDKKKIQKNQIEYLIQDIKEQILRTNSEIKIAHILIKNFFVNGESYIGIPVGEICKDLVIEVQFICFPKKIIDSLKNLFENYQININKVICTNYAKSLLDNDLNNLSEAGLRAFVGFNMNEVFINPKKLTKVGFFERLFHIFS